jgi:hypothetical protein
VFEKCRSAAVSSSTSRSAFEFSSDSESDLSNNWADVPGGTFNGTVHVPDPNNPTVFFRLSTTP